MRVNFFQNNTHSFSEASRPAGGGGNDRAAGADTGGALARRLTFGGRLRVGRHFFARRFSGSRDGPNFRRAGGAVVTGRRGCGAVIIHRGVVAAIALVVGHRAAQLHHCFCTRQ